MEPRATEGRNERVLILAPVGRDGQLMGDVLKEAGIQVEVCGTFSDLCHGIRTGAGAVIVADEALHAEAMKSCVEAVGTQPSWSDIPMIVLTTRDYATRSDNMITERVRPLGHVTILERPLRVATLVSVTRAALRSRRRQYDVRDHLEELRRAEQEIRFANEQLSAARDAALEANRLKSRFLANMSHELRTPLNAVIGYAEMIREEAEEDGNPVLKSDINRIIDASRHLLALINDILDLAKVEAGRMTLCVEPFEIGDLLYTVSEIVAPLVRRNSNTLVLLAPADLGTLVADEAKVRQCLLNLLSNASKFTEQGQIELGARREDGESDGESWVVFWVRDSGIGISPQDMRRLFGEFVQLDSSSTRRHDGTGLGLALTRRFCELMGGSLSVESRPGDGSTFTIRLPAAPRGTAPFPAAADQEDKPFCSPGETMASPAEHRY